MIDLNHHLIVQNHHLKASINPYINTNLTKS
jgi:hypothetical protein